MAGEDGCADGALIDELLNQPHRFSFFEIVRLLETWANSRASVGHRGPAEEEALRFRALPTLGFPPGDVRKVDVRELGGRTQYELSVTFLGVYGPASPLPAHYTERLIGYDNEPGRNLQKFLDLFNHRFVSLFFRTWLKYRYYARFEPGAEDETSRKVFSLIGLGPGALRRQGKHLAWPRLLPFVGLLGMRRHSAEMLRSVLAHYFGNLPVQVHQWVERVVVLEPAQRNKLGLGYCSAGDDLILGDTIRDVTGKFRVSVGPLDFERFRSFLPGGSRYVNLCRLVQLARDDHLEFDLELVLARDEVPALNLAEDGNCQLGWSTWLAGPTGRDEAVVIAGELDMTGDQV